MKKQKNLLLTAGVVSLIATVAGCSAASTNTAANLSNKTNANVAMVNANAVNANNISGGATPAAR